MLKIKTVFITGARSEYGLLYPVLKTFRDSPEFDFKLIVTGSHLSPFFGLTKNEIIKDGFKIDAEVPFHIDADSKEVVPLSLGNGIIQFVQVLKDLKPDIIFVLGDRVEILSFCLAAVFMKIPIAHIHGGDNTSFLMPDTYVRHSITKFAHLHFPATENSKENLIKMGEDRKRIFVVGNLGVYSLDFKEIPDYEKIKKNYNLYPEKEYALLIHHPYPYEREKSLEELKFILNILYKYDIPFVAVSPNTDPGGREMYNFLYSESLKVKFLLFHNFPFRDYLALLKNAKFIIGNSSSALYEAPLFKVPVINVGKRQKFRERGGYIYDAESYEDIELCVKKVIRGEFPKFIPSPFKRIRGDLKIKKVLLHFFKKYSREEIFNKKLNIK